MPKTTKKLVVSKFDDEGNHEPVFNHQLNEVKMTLNSTASNGNKKFFAKFIVTKNDQRKTIHLKGQQARTLIALKEARNRGVTSLQSHDLKLLRLSSYIHILRHEHNIKILTIAEGERRTACYILMDAVQLLDDSSFQREVQHD